jgi:hypothetical protein
MAPKSKPKAPRRKKLKTTGRASALPYLKMISDPWSSDAVGCGLPDFNSDPTITWKNQYSQTLNADALGNFLLTVFPRPYNGVYQNAVNTLTDPVITGGAYVTDPNYANLSTSFVNFRPLVYAVEANYIGQATTQAGILGIARQQVSPTIGDSMSSVTNQRMYKETPSHTGVAARVAMTNMAFGAVTGAPVCCCLVILGSGLPAGAAIRVRYTMVYEFTVAATSLLNKQVTHTINNPSQVATAASLVSADAILATGDNAVQKLISKGTQLIEVAGAVNGLYQSSKPILSLLSEFAAMVV